MEISKLLKRKLHPAALYKSDSFMSHHIQQSLESQAMGRPAPFGDCTDYAGIEDRAGERIRKMDPGHVLGRILMKIIDADMGSEKYQALTSLFDEYREIPEDKRKNEGLNADYLSRLRAITDSGN